MQIETEAYMLGYNTLHSNKSGKDYVKFTLVIEGQCCAFFTRAAEGAEIVKSKPCVDFSKTHAPTKCVVSLSLKFSDKGVFVDLKGIA